MNFKKLSSRLFRSLGAVTAVSLLTGVLAVTPAHAATTEQGPTANSTSYPYSISASVDLTTFYTNDDTPTISVDASSVPASYLSPANEYRLIYIDVDTQKTFSISSPNFYEQKIRRFFKEPSKRFKVVLGKVNGVGAGSVEVSVDRITDVLAESNEVTVNRGKWSITTAHYPDHVTTYDEEVAVIGYTVNQPLTRLQFTQYDFNPYYGVYLYNLEKNQFEYMPLPSADKLEESRLITKISETETLRYQIYVAKRVDDLKTLSQLEDIQTVSDVIVIPPRKWGIKLNSSTTVVESPGRQRIDTDFTTTRNVWVSKIQSLYLSDADTGKILCNSKDPDHYPDHPVMSCSVDSSVKSVKGHIARRDQSVEYVSELEGLMASSDEDYPERISLLEDTMSIFSEQHENGANPSTADCRQICYGDPINSLNGELFENESDLAVEGTKSLDFVRSSSSLRASSEGPLGRGTTFSYNMSLRGSAPSLKGSSTITVVQENGSTVRFSSSQDSSGNRTFSTSPNIQATLSETDSGEYRFKRVATQDVFLFSPAGKLLRITDRIGNRIELNYTAGRLATVSNGESTISINWSGEHIVSVSDGIHTVSYEYSGSDLVKVVNSKLGSPKTYAYYPDGRVKTITHPNGGSYETSYGADGRVAVQRDPRGGETKFSYSKAGANYATVVTLPDGAKTREVYNGQGRLIEKTIAYDTAEAKNYSYSYNSTTGDLESEVFPASNGSTREIKYRYDSRGNLIYLANPAGEVYRFEYNDLNLLAATVNPAGKTATNEYDSSGLLTKTIGYDGSITSYSYNAKGVLSGIERPTGHKDDLKTSYGYESFGLINKSVDTRGGSTSYEYDSAHNPAKIIDSLGNEIEFTYSNSNPDLPEEISYPNGAHESIRYDGAGRRIEQVAKDGKKTQYGYDLMDNLISVTTPHGTTRYEYDGSQRLISTTNEKGARTEYKYDARGMLIEEKLPNEGVNINEYGEDGFLSSSRDAEGNRTTYSYDSAGRLISLKDASNQSTSFSYDKLGNLLQKTPSSGNWIRYSYDSLGRVTGTNEKDLRKTSYSYDSNGNLTRTTYADGTSEARSYDSEDNLTEVIARDGKRTSYSYDALNRLAVESRPDGTSVTLGYDALGNPTSSDYGSGYVYESSYNLKGQRVESKTPEGLVTEYGYDAAGDLISRATAESKVGYDRNEFGEITAVNYPSGTQVNYSYDSVGKLETVKSGADTLASYSYDSRYNLNSSSFGNGVTETDEFDGLNRLDSITTSNSTGELYKRNLQFDTDSQISRATTNYSGGIKQDRSYQYSALGTISSVKDELTASTKNFSFDPLNNLKTLGSNSYSYKASTSQLSTSVDAGVSKHSYDNRGNRTKTLNTTTSEMSDYTWTKSNQLESAYVLASRTGSPKTISYGYDSEGLLASRSSTAPRSIANRFSWDTASNSMPVLLEDGSYEYIYGAEATPLLQVEKSSGKRTYLHGDERNSVVLATDNAGQPLWYRDYDEYGSKYTKTTASNASGSPETRFGYAGEYLDPDTGLYLLRARWYDPKTAAFLSTDPAILSTGESHSYASGNPLSYTDPLGLWSMDSFKATRDAALTSVSAVVDGILPFTIASDLSNRFVQDSVNRCSELYTGVNKTTGFVSLFIPAVGPAKVLKVLSLSGKTVGAKALALIPTNFSTKRYIAGTFKIVWKSIKRDLGIGGKGASYLKMRMHPSTTSYMYELAEDATLDEKYSNIERYTIDGLVEKGPKEWILVSKDPTLCRAPV